MRQGAYSRMERSGTGRIAWDDAGGAEGVFPGGSRLGQGLFDVVTCRSLPRAGAGSRAVIGALRLQEARQRHQRAGSGEPEGRAIPCWQQQGTIEAGSVVRHSFWFVKVVPADGAKHRP